MVGAALCWSLGGVFIKFIPWGSMSIVGLRALFATVVFAVYRRSVKTELTRGNILSAICLASTIILYVYANKLTTAAAAIFLQFTSPTFVILIQLIFYGRKPKKIDIAAVSVTAMGMLLFFAGRLEGGGLTGNLFAIASGLSFAGVFVCNRRKDVNPENALMLGFIITAAIGLPFAFFDVTADLVAWSAVALLGTIQVGLAYVFFSIGIRKTPALLACLITAIEPVLSPVWVALATGEIPGGFALAGGVVIISTVVVYNLWKERHPETVQVAKN